MRRSHTLTYTHTDTHTHAQLNTRTHTCTSICTICTHTVKYSFLVKGRVLLYIMCIHACILITFIMSACVYMYVRVCILLCLYYVRACVRVDILCTFSYCVSYFVPMVFLLIESFYLACGEPPAVVISYVSNALLPYIFGVAFQPLYASYSFSPILLRLLCFFFGFFSVLFRFSLLSDDNGFSLVCSIFAIVFKNSLLTLFRAPYLLYQSVCLLVSISLPVCRLSFHPAICLIHSHSQPFSNSLPLVFTIYLLPISLFLSVCLSVNLSLISAIYFSCCVCLF